MDSYTKQGHLADLRADLAAQRSQRRQAVSQLDRAFKDMLADRDMLDALSDDMAIADVVAANASYIAELERTASLHRLLSKLLQA